MTLEFEIFYFSIPTQPELLDQRERDVGSDVGCAPVCASPASGIGRDVAGRGDSTGTTGSVSRNEIRSVRASLLRCF